MPAEQRKSNKELEEAQKTVNGVKGYTKHARPTFLASSLLWAFSFHAECRILRKLSPF